MQRKDIKVGTDYAVTTYGTAAPGARTLSRAKVTAVVTKGTATGVDVVFPNGHTRRLLTRQIACTWEDQVDLRDEAEALAQQRRDDLTQEAEARNESVRYLKSVLPADEIPWWAQKDDIKPHTDWSGISGGESWAPVTVNDLADLVRAAYAAGQASVEGTK